MEKNFSALKSFFSGTSEPTFTKVPGMPWYDINQKILKIRNSVGTGWVGVMTGNESFKIWVFLNAITAQEGWDVDGAAVDQVLALKGGSTYTTGGVKDVGTWQIPDHTLVESEIPDHTHPVPSGGAHLNTLESATGGTGGGVDGFMWTNDGWTGPVDKYTESSGPHTHTPDSFGGDGAHNHGNTMRTKAAVGIMVFPDVTA